MSRTWLLARPPTQQLVSNGTISPSKSSMFIVQDRVLAPFRSSKYIICLVPTTGSLTSFFPLWWLVPRAPFSHKNTSSFTAQYQALAPSCRLTLMPKTTVRTFSLLIIGAKGHHLPQKIHLHLVPRTERLAPSPLKDWSPRQGHWSVFRFDDWYQMVLYPLTKYVICLMPKTGSLPPSSLQDWCQKQTHWPAFPFGDWYHMASWPCKNASYVSCPGQAHRHILFSAICFVSRTGPFSSLQSVDTVSSHEYTLSFDSQNRAIGTFFPRQLVPNDTFSHKILRIWYTGQCNFHLLPSQDRSPR